MAKDSSGGGESRGEISGGGQYGPVLQTQTIRDVHFNSAASAASAVPRALAELPPLAAGLLAAMASWR